MPVERKIPDIPRSRATLLLYDDGNWETLDELAVLMLFPHVPSPCPTPHGVHTMTKSKCTTSIFRRSPCTTYGNLTNINYCFPKRRETACATQHSLALLSRPVESAQGALRWRGEKAYQRLQDETDAPRRLPWVDFWVRSGNG